MRFSWLASQGNFTSRSAKRKSAAAGYNRRLRIERLEDRRLLAITVNTLVDELDGSILDGDISLRDALLAATPFETIGFDASLTAGGPATLTLTLGELRITKDVTIQGPGSELLTIDASGNDLTPFLDNGDGSRVFNVNNGGGTNIDVKINALTLTGGDAILDGGAIRNLENLATTGLVVAGNSSQRDGGGIFTSGSLTLINSTVSGNVASRDGGGVFSSGPYLTVHESNISNNTANGGGGGIANGAAANYLMITDSTINGNFANGSGGGVLQANGNARITGSTFQSNRSFQQGAGVSSSAGSLTVIDSYVSYNRTYQGNGGGIFSNTGTATVLRTTITGNTASNTGGGIHSSTGSLTVTESSLLYNRSYSSGDGGGIWIDNGTLAVTDCTISGSFTNGNGGGIASETADATVLRTTMANNWGNDGGGIWSSGGSLNISESTLNQNFAPGSGGGIFSDDAFLNIQSSTISGNAAGSDGGGLWIQASAGAYVSLKHSTVAFNRARAYYSGLGAGGGIITSGSTIVGLNHTIVANNVRAGTADDIFGKATAYYSLIGVDSNALINNTGGGLIGTSVQPIDPLLDALADNGGPTLTHALLSGSLAVDAGFPNLSPGYDAPLYDQRGPSFSRVRNGDGQPGARIDIGAFEVIPGTIRGQKWHDLNGNGVKDPGEPGLEGWTIYLDANGNGEFDIDSPTFASTNVPQSPPPFSYVFSTLTVDGQSAIDDVNVTFDITAPIDGNLFDLYLVSPAGAYTQLFHNVGGSGSNFTNTTLDDEAATSIFSAAAPFTGSFRPQQSLSGLDGQNPNGTWTLYFYNNDFNNIVTLNSWSLTFTTSEKTTTTDAEGNYTFFELPPGSYGVGEVQQPGWELTTSISSAATALNNLNANNAAISALVPDRFDFSEGDFGNYINDGGNDMYDGGNFLNTNLAGGIFYTTGLVTPGDFAFGPGSEYFTAKYPGLFVMGATNISINSFQISGNVGADGGGLADGGVVQTTVDGLPYTIFVKRVYNADDPSVNHIVMVPGNGAGVSHTFDAFTDNDFHSVTGLSSVNEIYYALVARANGQYLSNRDVLNIANEFLSNIGTSELYTVVLNSGDVVEGIDFGNYAPNGSIQGQKWHDLNGDGVHDPGEPGLPDWTIFLDENRNNILDATQRLEPDNYVRGTPLTNALPGAHLSIPELPNVSVVAAISFNAASTGTQVIGSGSGIQWGNGRSLRIDFDQPTDFVSLDVISDGSSEMGTMTAFNSDGNVVATVTTLGLSTGRVQFMAIARESSDIAYVIAGAGVAGTEIHLDNLRVGAAEPMRFTDAMGNYAFDDLPVGDYLVAELMKSGWTPTSSDPFADTQLRLAASHSAITSLVQNRYDFLEGETGNRIFDGGNNMYDEGNILDTNRASAIPYTNGAIVPTAAFGPGSEYFTAKFPGLFVMGATNMSINAFSISGNLGANGLGQTNSMYFNTTVDGQTFTVIARRVYNAGTPSINQVIVIPGNAAGVVPHFGVNTDEDFFALTGMASTDEMYYALVSANGGAFLSDVEIRAIANQFIRIIISGARPVTVGANEDVTGIDFSNEGPVVPALLGDYNRDSIVNAADYTVWRNSLWQTDLTGYSGADGDGNGNITWADYEVWKAHYGQSLFLGAAAGVELLSAETAAADEAPFAPSPPVAVLSAAFVPATQSAELFSAPAESIGLGAQPVAASPLRPGKVVRGEHVLNVARRDDALLQWLANDTRVAACFDKVRQRNGTHWDDTSAAKSEPADAMDEAFALLSNAL